MFLLLALIPSLLAALCTLATVLLLPLYVAALEQPAVQDDTTYEDWSTVVADLDDTAVIANHRNTVGYDRYVTVQPSVTWESYDRYVIVISLGAARELVHASMSHATLYTAMLM